jgi:gliding motility-associated-like protein
MQGSQVVVSPSGTTIYTVTASDGCSATLAKDTGVVFVSGSIPVLTLPPAASGCTPVCMTFTMQNPGNSIVHWSWNFGDGIKDSVQNPAHCYNRPGNYSVSLAYASVSGCTAVVSKNSEVVVFPASVADFSASSSETDILDSYIQFYNQSANASSWHWSFGDSEYSGVQSPVHTYSGPGTYVVTLITNNAYGCADTITHTIEIKDVFTFYAPGAFSPNGDELNERFLPTGTGWDNSTFSMDVFDRWGNLVFHSRNPFEGWTIKDDKIPEDTYVWKVSLQDVYGKSHQYNGVVSLVK